MNLVGSCSVEAATVDILGPGPAAELSRASLEPTVLVTGDCLGETALAASPDAVVPEADIALLGSTGPGLGAVMGPEGIPGDGPTGGAGLTGIPNEGDGLTDMPPANADGLGAGEALLLGRVAAPGDEASTEGARFDCVDKGIDAGTLFAFIIGIFVSEAI